MIDADQDGTITAKELEGAVAALKTLDKDGDGKITRDEARPQFGGPGGPGAFGRGGFGRGGENGQGREGGGPPTAESFVERLLERDANKDGKLDAEELGERGGRLLESGDANKDGVLDAEELKAAAARMMERFGGGRPGGGRPEGERPEGEEGREGGRRPQRPRPEAEEGDRI